MTPAAPRGRFVTFEGGEGSGKSTQARRFAERLSAVQSVLLTREPGGTPGGEAIRTLLVTGERERWTPLAEALLMYAARAEHVSRVVRPALAGGTWVVSDRFADSSMAYQGFAHGVPREFLRELDRAVVAECRPDLTVLVDVPVQTGLARAKARHAAEKSGEHRFEGFGPDFHERLRAGFLEIARTEPGRVVVVDGRPGPDEVAAAVWAAAAPRLGL